MSDYKMIDYGSIYEAILADNRQMRTHIKQLDRDADALATTFREVLADLEVQAAELDRLRAELAAAKQSRDLLAHALLTAVDNIEDGGVDKWTLNITDEVDLAFSIAEGDESPTQAHEEDV